MMAAMSLQGLSTWRKPTTIAIQQQDKLMSGQEYHQCAAVFHMHARGEYMQWPLHPW
jgi:hypothetical protein